MTRSTGRRARIGALAALALGALALLALPGLAAAKDRNHDRIPDRWEKRHKLSLKVDQARRDQDGDHLRNLAEFQAGDDPRDSDSDDDGVVDGEENAGTIASFDASGTLTIDLFGGDTIVGQVTEGTEIECDDGHDGEPGASSSADSQGEGPGDDQGTQGGEVGDDDSGPGPTAPGPGDDNENDASCTTADLTEGATVREAELEAQNGGALFTKVELSGRSAP